MPDLPPSALAVLQRRLGVATAAMLTAAGVSSGRRKRLVRQGVLARVHHRVYRIASAEDSFLARCVALCLAYPCGFVTGPSGGRLLGVRRMLRSDEIHFCVPHGFHHDPVEGVVFHQSTSITPMDIMRLDNGLVVASWPRLGFDLARHLSPEDHASVIEQILADRRCTAGTLAGVGRRLIHPGRAGSWLFATTMANRIAGGALESHAEVLLAQALAARHVPVVAQLRNLTLPNGSHIRIDLAVEDARWAVELDIHPDHLLDGATKDKRRDRQLHQIDWQVERVTALDMQDVAAIADELTINYHLRVSALEKRAA